MRGDRVVRAAAVLVIAAACCFIVQAGAGEAAGLVLPFLGAWIASAPARPLAEWLAVKSGMSRKVTGAAVTLLVFFFFGYGLIRLSGRAAEEISSLAAVLSELGGEAEEFLRRLEDRFDSPVYETVIAALHEGAVSFGGQLTSFLTAVCGAIPGSVLSVFVFAASFYYLTSDREGAAEGVLALLPRGAAKAVRTGAQRVSGALFGYLRAYLLLMGITFFELLAGLCILRAPYAFVLSLIIAVVDALPVLGAGTVLVPWAAVSFLRGRTAFGTGLLVLLGVMSLVRQLLEPRLIGRFIGVHPFAALAAVYVGYRLWGFFGMLAAPVLLYAVKSAGASKSGGNAPDE